MASADHNIEGASKLSDKDGAGGIDISNALTFLFFIVIIVASIGCIESKKSPATNETEIATPFVTEQKLPASKPLEINDTFVTWSRGYYSNLSYEHPYFRVIINYSEWNEFLDNQGYLVPGGPPRLEGELYPGINVMPQTIEPADFNNYFIIAAMMGRRGGTGAEIEIKNISRINNVVKVTVRMYYPNRGVSVESAPYHIVIVKREILPKGNSTFNFIDTEGKELGKLEVKVNDKEK